MKKEVVEAFGDYTRRYSSSQGADAREFRREQRTLWKSLFDKINEVNQGPSRDQDLAQDIHHISSNIETYIEQLVEIEQNSDDEWIVQSKLPLIDQHLDLKVLASRDRGIFIAAVVYEAVRALGTIPGMPQGLASFNTISNGYYVALQMTYAAEKAANKTELFSEARNTIESSKSLFSKLEEHLSIYREATVINSERHKSDLENFAKERQGALQDCKNLPMKKLKRDSMLSKSLIKLSALLTSGLGRPRGTTDNFGLGSSA